MTGAWHELHADGASVRVAITPGTTINEQTVALLAKLALAEAKRTLDNPPPPLICQCGHMISHHVTTAERHGCFPAEGPCDCEQFVEQA